MQKDNFHNHTTIPLSAERALYAKLMSNNLANESQKETFYKRAFGEEYELEDLTPKRIEKAILSQLRKSNFDILETEIINALLKKADKILLKAVKEGLELCLERVFNAISMDKGALETKDAEIQRIIKEAKAILDKLKAINADNKFKKKAKEIATNEFSSFQQVISDVIVDEFSNNKFYYNSSFTFIKERFSRFFQPNQKICYENKEEMDKVISDLNGSMAVIMEREFQVYWGIVTKKIYQEYNIFRNDVLKKVEPALKEVEKVIQTGLNIPHLYANPITYSTTDEYDFWGTLNNQSYNVIKAKKDWRIKFWFIIPYPQWYTEYCISTNDYRDFILNKVSKFIDNKLVDLELAMEQEMGNTLKEAKAQVESKANEYIKQMNEAIKQKAEGEKLIPERIEQLSQNLEICNNHLQELSKIVIEPVENVQNQVEQKIYNIEKIDNANFL